MSGYFLLVACSIAFVILSPTIEDILPIKKRESITQVITFVPFIFPLLQQQLHLNLFFVVEILICPHCGNHLKITAYERLEMIYDQGKYKELYKSTQRVNPLEFPGYDEKLEFLQQKTGLNEAVVVASGKINGTN